MGVMGRTKPPNSNLAWPAQHSRPLYRTTRCWRSSAFFLGSISRSCWVGTMQIFPNRIGLQDAGSLWSPPSKIVWRNLIPWGARRASLFCKPLDWQTRHYECVTTAGGPTGTVAMSTAKNGNLPAFAMRLREHVSVSKSLVSSFRMFFLFMSICYTSTLFLVCCLKALDTNVACIAWFGTDTTNRSHLKGN